MATATLQAFRLGSLTAGKFPVVQAASAKRSLLFTLLFWTQCSLLFSTSFYFFVSATTNSMESNGAAVNTDSAESPYLSFMNEESAMNYFNNEGTTRLIEQRDIQATIGKSWWKLSEQLILKSQSQGKDISSAVRSAISDISARCDELTRLIDSNREEEVTLVSPAFQWAQSETRLFINIKFTYRWSSPGALFVEDEQFISEEGRFFFTGVGSHSGIKKKYVLDLQLFKPIDPNRTQWSFASVGKAYVELFKAKPGMWKYLTQPEQKIPNMQIWWDMQEKYPVDEVEDTSVADYGFPSAKNEPADGKKKKKKKRKRKNKDNAAANAANGDAANTENGDAENGDAENGDVENANAENGNAAATVAAELGSEINLGGKLEKEAVKVIGNVSGGEDALSGAEVAETKLAEEDEKEKKFDEL